MNIVLRYIGKSADDLRFFILADGRHAGGITVHSAKSPQFSYGIAIAGNMRRRGIAKAALLLLFREMERRGFAQAVVQIEPGNAASLALHASLGFVREQADGGVITLKRNI